MKHFHFREISSTNDYASELLEKEDTVVVTADYQISGRGRNNHTWFGSYGTNVYFSYGKRHSENLPIEELIKYQIAGCLASNNVLEKATNSNIFRLKYPNDVYALHETKYSKISGIIVEHTFSGSQCTKSIIGIGINILQESFGSMVANDPISLKMLGFDLTPNELIEPLIDEVSKQLTFSPEAISAEWQNKLNIVGKEIEILGKSGKWKAKRILEDSRLLLVSIDTNDEIIIDNADSIRYTLE